MSDQYLKLNVIKTFYKQKENYVSIQKFLIFTVIMQSYNLKELLFMYIHRN